MPTIPDPPPPTPPTKETYKTKYFEVKKRLDEVEKLNRAYSLKNARLKINNRKMRLERTMILECLGRNPRKSQDDEQPFVSRTEEIYKTKYFEMKKRLNEVKKLNRAYSLRNVGLKINNRKMRLERTMILECLGNGSGKNQDNEQDPSWIDEKESIHDSDLPFAVCLSLFLYIYLRLCLTYITLLTHTLPFKKSRRHKNSH